MKNNEVLTKNIPKELKALPQWVAWRKENRENGKPFKVPLNPRTAQRASVCDPETWGTFREALDRYKRNSLDGIGFVLTNDDPYVGFDLDNSYDPKTKELSAFAQEIIKRTNSYAEISPSGRGLRILAKGGPIQKGKKGEWLEIYGRGRFLTLTGQHLEGTPSKIRKRRNTINNIVRDYFGKEKKMDSENNTTEPLSNDEIIKRCMNAQDGEKSAKLWGGDRNGYESPSEADLALCRILAFWTKKDPKRMDEIFRRSGLIRGKWDEIRDPQNNRTYGEMTIQKAIDSCIDVFSPDFIQNAVNCIPAIVKICKADPKKAVECILKDKNLMNKLTLLSKENHPKLEELLITLKTLGVVVRDVEALKRAINARKRREKKIQEKLQNSDENISIKSILPEAPVSESLVMANGYIFDQHGIIKVRSRTGSQELVSRHPVLIQGRMINLVDGSEYIRLAWQRDNKWEFRIVNRLIIADARHLVELAEFGVPVTSVRAPRMVEFLSDFEAINFKLFPQATVTHKLGWQGKDENPAFLWGRNFINSEGKLLSRTKMEELSPQDWSAGSLVFFQGHNIGEDQVANGFYKKGKFAEWKKAVKKVRMFPWVTFGIYASLAAPLLKIIAGAENFIVDWAYATSRGKTTTLRIAASCWGNPDGKAEGSVMKSWDMTRVAFERNAAVLQSLPFIIDDTKRAKDMELVRQFIYDFSSGQGRARGAIEGLRETVFWQTIALSSGESKITSFSTGEGGVNARVLSLWKAPFGKKSPEKAKLIEEIEKIIRDNFGHAGLRFVKYLIKRKDRWDEWKLRYSRLTEKYREMAGSNEVALRQTKYLALIHLTAIIAEKALELKIHYKEHLKKVSQAALAETSDADKAKEARELVFGWVAGNQSSFWEHETPNKPPYGGWLGVWDPDEDGKTVALLPPQLHKFLKEHGYAHAAITSTWKDKGWLDTRGEDRGRTRRVAMGKERPRCYVLKKAS